MFIFSESCPEFEQHHYKSLHTQKINTTRVKWTFNESTYKSKKGPLSLFCMVSWILEAITLHLQGRNPYIWKCPNWENLMLLLGVGFSGWLWDLCGREFHQAGGACLNPRTCQCMSAEPDSDCTTAMRWVWDKKKKWGNEHRHMEELDRESSSICAKTDIYQIYISSYG